VDRHGVRARCHRSPGGGAEFGTAVARGDRPDRARGARRAHFRPPDRHPAPRCETGQYPAGPGQFGPLRAGAADRLRHRAPAGFERAPADVLRRNPRHARLLGAGAGARRSADTGRRPLLARRDAVHGRRGQGCLRPGRRLRHAHRPADGTSGSAGAGGGSAGARAAGSAGEESATAVRARGSRAGAGAGAAGTGGGVRTDAAVRDRWRRCRVRCGSGRWNGAVGRRDVHTGRVRRGYTADSRHSRNAGLSGSSRHSRNAGLSRSARHLRNTRNSCNTRHPRHPRDTRHTRHP
jgi:hypothetical protein